jgi:hypothetical protein
MEQIIYLEIDDDILVVRDRLRRAQSSSVILVVPAGCRALSRSLDLRLLRRQAAALDLRVVLVSGSAAVRDLAKDEGLPVLTSLAAGRRAVRRGGKWKATDEPGYEGLVARIRRQGPRWWYWLVGPLVLTAVLGTLVWSVVMIWPSATVHVAPAQEPIGVSLWVEASMGTQAVAWDRLQMPARVVQVEVVERDEIETTGIANVAAGKAGGMVLFVNSTVRQVRLPLGTIVSTSAGTPVRFQTTASAVVDPRGRVRVPVEALEPGPGGNVPANRINRVEGGLAASVKVINEAGTGGGESDQVRRVTYGDKQQLSDLLKEKLIARAHAEISAVLEDEFLPIESMQINPYSIRENYDHHVDDKSDTLALETRGVVWGLAISQPVAEEMTRRALARQVRSGFEMMPATMHISRGQEIEVDRETGNVRFVMEGVALMEARIDTSLVQEAIRGRPLDQATAYLSETLPVRAAPSLEVRPPWMLRVPWLSFRIRVAEDQLAEEVASVLPEP